MKIAITAESTIDMPKELLDLYEIKTTPFSINFDGKLVQDEFGVSSKIFQFVEEKNILPKTSAVSPEQFTDFFSTIKNKYDAIIHISLSSMMSSAYNNACASAKNLENVYVIDSKSLSTGIGLLAIFASNLNKTKKYSAEEIVKLTTEQVEKVEAGFVLEHLNYLHKGGRCSALTLLGANILKIKPEIIVSNGKMIVGKKYIGSINKVVDKYCQDLLSKHPNPNLDIVFVTHSSSMPIAEDILTKMLTARGFKVVYNTLAGGTICSHCGPNCIGVLFLDN